MLRVDEVRSFPGQHERHWYTYVHYDLPWPARDHDCTIAYRQVANTAGLTTIRFESVSLKSYPLRDGIERITGLSGRWEFQSQDQWQYGGALFHPNHQGVVFATLHHRPYCTLQYDADDGGLSGSGGKRLVGITWALFLTLFITWASPRSFPTHRKHRRALQPAASAPR